MPANLTPEYERADRAYRQATTDEERLTALREMLRVIPKHKGTDRMQGDLKRRISQLRKAEAKTGASRGPDPFHVAKTGAGQVTLLGPANVGKSMLLATTTNAPAKVAEYPYTTGIPMPGMWQYEDVQIQLVDTPPVVAGHVPPGLMGTLHLADVLCVMVDCADDPLEQAEMILGVLAEKNLSLHSTPRNEMDATDFSQYSGIIVANKIDVAPAGNVSVLRELYEGRLEVWPISAATGEGLPALLRRLWQLLAVVRVYTKQPGKPPDHDKPFTLDAGSSVEDLAGQIHRELPAKMKFVRIWGDGRFSGQQVSRDEILRDKDVVEIHQ